MNFSRFQALLLVLLAAAVLSGCASNEIQAEPDDPHFAPVQPSRMEPPPPTRGSLYQASYSQALFGDRKAYRIGDVITVNLEEQTRSSKSASTDMSRNTNINVANPNIGGRDSPVDLSVNMNSARGFSGDASADQSNSLLGSITVTVHDVYPNGNLLVRGEKWLTLNQGSEYVRVSGIVRPEDIRPDNSVSSTLLADARLTYSGTGDLANANRQGWLARFFNSGWWPL
ncbi:flagellar basal body L-ring protein FlgH [Marinospirillum alkaliphilum]|uniref:Flagellar L-ring protein n=1 Tax=Marinospirillum alkaliphilum DSM 21637 TaxID=1122209 RepID=A0A1K1UZR2_9GAMM|nr:flagellar basal body L-ring protein FlgH [Marinospirillum alkaliphilum]SFX18296.1 flagellar L-ring protein precursor FlgH [Marinospirillum alkaliphilum DSM 21637]